MKDVFWFIIFPYLAIAVAVVGSIYRLKKSPSSWTSYSSQFLESKKAYWGSVPWHYGIILILLAHLVAAFLPLLWRNILAHPVRLYVLEVTGYGLAIYAFVGLLILLIRRISDVRVQAVTTVFDYIVLTALLFQVATGIHVALSYPYGGAWFPFTAGKWLRSLLLLSPDVEAIRNLPLMVKVHAVGGFFIVLLIPFTRLVHLFSVPVRFVWRAPVPLIWVKSRGRS